MIASQAERRFALALMFIAPALWSVNYLVARWAPGVIAPHMLALWRWVVGALLLGAFCWREIAAKRAAIRAEAPRFIVLGALGMWVCGAFVYIGARSTTAINIGLLYAVSPVLIALLSARWLHERFGVRAWCGVALALAGVVHVVLGDRREGFLAAELPGDLAPRRLAVRLAITAAAIDDVEFGADEDGDPGFGYGADLGPREDRVYPPPVFGGGTPLGQVVEGGERVRFAATELGGHVEDGGVHAQYEVAVFDYGGE